MPNPVNFGGRQYVEPGVASQILGQVPSPAIVASFANIVLIDTGSQGQGVGQTQPAYGGGAGITGELSQNGESIYKFSRAPDFQKFVRGGVLYDLANYLFSPSNATNANGPATVYHARAATTVCPLFTMNLPAASGSAGTLVFKARNEGLSGNGVMNASNIVTRGYGLKIKAGIINTNAFIIEFYEGQFRGLGPDGVPYDGINEADFSQNTLVAGSIEFTTAAQFIAWTLGDASFQQYFALGSATVTSTNTITNAVLSTYSGIQLFAGGTTTYSLSALQAVLDNISDLDNSAFLCDDYGVTPTVSGTDIQGGCNKGGLSTFNQAILAHIQVDALYTDKQMYVGGGQDSSQYSNGTDGTKDQAIFWNTDSVVTIHSAVKVPATIGGTGSPFKYNSSLYNAAMVCGRIAGLEPQTPGTYKDIRIIGLKHALTKTQRKDALFSGILHIRNVATLGWVINQSIDTLQRNSSIVYNDGTTPEISIKRIKHQLNKELLINATQFIGGNLNTVSGDDLVNFTNNYLLARTAEPLKDNLIITGPHKVTAVYTNGAWSVTYCFLVNAPVNQIFFTGFILDPSVAVGNVNQ